MVRSLWILLVLSLMSCATTPPSTDSSELRVQQASEQFWAVRERGDAATFAAQFTEDGVFMVPGVADAMGRTAIQELAQLRFAGARTTDSHVHKREIKVLGDSAHEIAWFMETYPADSMRMLGRYVIVWNRGADNVWRVRRFMYNFSGAQPVS
jgi:uncharacterized protein (TIGR02246 family)